MMALFKKKPDPISERARALTDEIAALEAQIRKLDARLQKEGAEPNLRSTASAEDETPARSLAPAATVQEPVFEEVRALESVQEPASTPEHYNDLGVRKYDLPALFRRIRNHFRGPTSTTRRRSADFSMGRW